MDGNQDYWEMNEDEWEEMKDLDADIFEEYQVIDPDNVEPPEKEKA